MFPRRAEESGPVCFVHDGDNASPAENELMSRNLVDLEAFGQRRDVVKGDVEGRGLGVAKELSTYVVRSTGRCLGKSWMSSGFRQGLHWRMEK